MLKPRRSVLAQVTQKVLVENPGPMALFLGHLARSMEGFGRRPGQRKVLGKAYSVSRLQQPLTGPLVPSSSGTSYSSSKKSSELLLGRPRMVNLWDTLVQCSRLEATRSYSSAALGNRSCSSLGVHRGRVRGQKSDSEQQERLELYHR